MAGIDDGEVLAWCVVANVAEETWHGPGGESVRRGLPHFNAGAKVWVLPAQWGDGWEDAFVVGHHRGSRQYTRIVIPRRHLTNYRVKGVYSPAVLRELTRPWGPDRENPISLWASREEAESMAAQLREQGPMLTAWFGGIPPDPDFTQQSQVPDPPPMELDRGGVTWYLAHFNANRAIYTTQPPPAEPSPGGQEP